MRRWLSCCWARTVIDLDPKDDWSGTPLSYAARSRREAVVRLLLSKDDVDSNFKDDFGLTPLGYAAAGGHEAVVKLLLSRDNVDPPTPRTALD
jgi:ankyrin repeat protein